MLYSFAISASGEAVVTASAFFQLRGTTQLDIACGKEANNTILPIRAGLTKFCPMPPKNCLTTTMATTPPKATIHSGMVTGTLNASRIPVTTALKSPMVFVRFIVLRQSHSDRTQEATETAVTAKARNPNRTTLAIRAGIKAKMTSSIIPVTVSDERTWGEALTVSFLSILIFAWPPLLLIWQDAYIERAVCPPGRHKHSYRTPYRR
ncbi:hypothetical protein SDC9_117339 [bioreactor metagenome]|uniref:Uncharacterized protein n=1 Tax=bioreactor metagenome TaxID=1076179 RepID=A0A645C878_9ZZZZ